MNVAPIGSNGVDFDSVHGCLAGGALGDSLGLPYEGLSLKRGLRLLGEPFPNRLFWGYGLVSDDTEHACLTALSLINSKFQVNHFRRELASSLKLWFLCLPPATGFATAKACLLLLLGVDPRRSGVRSAGNGPAMRAAVIGCSVRDVELVRSLIDASSGITHRDRRSSDGAFLVALASNWCRFHRALDSKSFFDYVDLCEGVPVDDVFAQKFYLLRKSLESGETTLDFAAAIEQQNGVTGFIVPTVLIALHAWLSNLDSFADVVMTCIRCGGDTDTVASIAGSLSGAYLGINRLPSHLGARIVDYPFSYSRLSILSCALVDLEAGRSSSRWLGCRWLLLPFRNIVLLVIVLLHGLRRLAPPY